ncbi:MAG: outer membrane protein assembly factor BamB [Gammaproteobacteria bacterium]|jgi:outer membrane protein assembly factor BamB
MKRFGLIICLITVCFALSGCDTFTTKDNTLPPAELTKITPKIKVAQLWSTNVGDGASKYYLRMAPTYANGLIYTASYSGRICAVNINTGNIVWQTNANARLTSGVSVNAGRLFAATEQGQVLAISLANGQRLWSTQVGSTILAAPKAYNGIVLAKSIDGSLTALSERNGRLIWRFRQTVPSLILHASSQPQFANGLVVAGFANGEVVAINSWSGRVAWLQRIAQPMGLTDIENMVDIDVNPVISQGLVYVATYQGYVAALDLKTGHVIWRHKISAYTGITSDYNNLYLTDAKSYVWAFSKDSGASLWRQTALQGRNLTGPAMLGRYLVIADGYGYLHWLSRNDGSIVARNGLRGMGVLTPPLVVGNTVVVYTQHGYLMAFRKM